MISPYYDLPSANEVVPLVLLDPTNYLLSNLTCSSDQVNIIFKNFSDLSDYLSALRQRLREQKSTDGEDDFKLPDLKAELFCLGLD
jgi:hypothetical protein